MSIDDYKLPASVASLPVLPSGGKVDQLRREQEENPGLPRSSAVIASPTPELDPSALSTSSGQAPAITPALRIKLLEGKIIAAISKVYDPEIPVNVYELGLIYGIDIADDNSVTVRMTLTAPGCPVAGSLPGEVEKQVESVDEVKEAEVILVWEPAWDKSRMSEAAMLQLGM
jgi:FeS assembly SUF system protein